MFKLTKILFLFFLLFFPSFVWAQSQPALSSSEQKAIVGRDLVFHRQYNEALNYFKKIQQEEPASVLGTFGQMAIWQVRMFENYDNRFEKEYELISSENKKIVDAVLNQKDPEAWELFLAAASSGLRGFYLMRSDAYFRALVEAARARKAMNRAIQKDPGFYDPYLGLGMYDYWRSVFTNRLTFLPFFKDKRQEGLEQVKLALSKGRVVGALAEVSLAFCLHESRDTQEAIPLLESILKKYPESIIVRNLLGDLYIAKGEYAKAHLIYDQLLKEHADITVAQFFKAMAYFKEGKLVEARTWYEKFLATAPVSAWKAYALTDLGRIDLKEGKEEAAFNHFKEAYHSYPDYNLPLKELNKLRERKK
ncbi:MAG: tetratricopeptide repeat protein [Deltaproteobacteria bacterium]|nr:tetratricopeptide repeat protein [Deltaproteobacteria bacterium]